MAQAMVAALVRTVFVQPDRKVAIAQRTQVAAMLRDRYAKAAELLGTAAEDILASMQAPPEHWRPIYSTNPLERLSKEMSRRTDVVGIFPNRAATSASSPWRSWNRPQRPCWSYRPLCRNRVHRDRWQLHQLTGHTPGRSGPPVNSPAVRRHYPGLASSPPDVPEE